MSETGMQVRNLVVENGKSSSEITHDLKVLGEGNMQKGIKKLAILCLEEGAQRGYKIGEINGIIEGTVGTLLLVGSLLLGYANTESKRD